MLFESMEPFYRHGPDILLMIRAIPRNRQEGLGNVVADGHGHFRLKVAVHAAPSDGEANLAITRLIAKAVGLPVSRVQIVQGATQRDKTLLLRSASDEMGQRPRHECRGLHTPPSVFSS